MSVSHLVVARLPPSMAPVAQSWPRNPNRTITHEREDPAAAFPWPPH